MQEASPTEKVSLRSERSEDEPVLYEIFVSTLQEEMNVVNWDDDSRQAFLQMQYHAMRNGYASMFPSADYSVIIRDELVLGRAVIDRSGEEIRLVDVAIKCEHRNQGIGSWLIRNLQSEAKRTGQALRLSVSATNPANGLYERLGFCETGMNGPYRLMEWRADQK